MRSAHIHGVFAHEQIVALDQFDTHLLRQKRVLEIGAVVLTRSQQDNIRIIGARRRYRTKIVEQQIGIMFHRRNRLTREEFREQPHHHLAVFQHVGNTRRRAQVIFQHVILTLARTH